MAQKKRDKILQSQARATETMAEASLRKANAIQDQCAMSLFTMPLEEGMSEEAKKYFTLRRQEEIQRLERRMQAEQRRAELEELEHAKLLKERNLEAPPARNRAVAASFALVVMPAPPSAPSPTIPDSAAAETKWTRAGRTRSASQTSQQMPGIHSLNRASEAAKIQDSQVQVRGETLDQVIV